MSAQVEPGPARNPPKSADYYRGLNTWLLRAVPSDARTIVEVGCAEGNLGGALREMAPGRRVFGVEREPGPARAAAKRLDVVFQIDVEEDLPDLPPQSVDCMLFGDVLEHLREPGAAVRRLLPLLRADGTILCCVPNVQHHSVLTSLLRGDFQYQRLGIMDETHVRFFTYASFTKLLLDAGLQPELVDHVPSPAPAGLLEGLAPALRLLGVHPSQASRAMGAYQYIFRARPLGWGALPERPITFIVCASDDAQLQDNLLASPCFRSGRHQVLVVRGAAGVGEAVSAALSKAQHDLVVVVHQDVYLPDGWTGRFLQQWSEASRAGRIGLAGVFGARLDPNAQGRVSRAGHVVDRHRLLDTGGLPAQVDTLDEVLLAFDRSSPPEMAPGLGFHLYGSDWACAVRRRGLRVLALDAPVFHNSLYADELPPAFDHSAEEFKRRWREELPVATNCGVLE